MEQVFLFFYIMPLRGGSGRPRPSVGIHASSGSVPGLALPPFGLRPRCPAVPRFVRCCGGVRVSRFVRFRSGRPPLSLVLMSCLCSNSGSGLLPPCACQRSRCCPSLPFGRFGFSFVCREVSPFGGSWCSPIGRYRFLL